MGTRDLKHLEDLEENVVKCGTLQYTTAPYLEWRAGVTWPCRKVKGDDEINPSLRSQDQGVWQVKCEPTVHHMNLFTFDIQWLVYSLKFIRILRK